MAEVLETITAGVETLKDSASKSNEKARKEIAAAGKKPAKALSESVEIEEDATYEEFNEDPSHDADDGKGNPPKEKLKSQNSKIDREDEPSTKQDKQDKKKTEQASDDDQEEDDSPTVSRELIRQAFKSGLSEEEIENLHNIGMLEKFLSRQADKTQPDADEKNSGVDENKGKGDRISGKLEWPELDPDLDPNVLQTFEVIKQVLGDFPERFARVEGYIQAAESRRAAEQFDKMFNALSDEYEPIFGKGVIGDFDSKSPQRKARGEVIREMVAIEEGYRSKGWKPPTMEEAFKRAIRALHGDPEKNEMVDALTEKLTKNKKVVSMRGRTFPKKSSRKTDGIYDGPARSDGEAISRIDQKIKELKLSTAAG